MHNVSVDPGLCLTGNVCHPCLAVAACPHDNVALNAVAVAYIIDQTKCHPCLESNRGVCQAKVGCLASKSIANKSIHSGDHGGIEKAAIVVHG